MKAHPNMSDEEWDAFLAAVPEEKEVPLNDSAPLLESEGVTEDDRQWWSGMSADEQKSFKDSMRAQNTARTVHYNTVYGLSPKEAVVMMHRTNVVYDDYPLSERRINELHQNGFGNDDYPLPWELGLRVGWFLKSQSWFTPEGRRVKHLLEEESTSFNAGVRRLIREGTL